VRASVTGDAVRRFIFLAKAGHTPVDPRSGLRPTTIVQRWIVAGDATDFVETTPRWWQWGTVLSVDAPVVTVLWQSLLARVAGHDLGWPPIVVLGLSVWLAYAADRWIEGWRLRPDVIRTPRHFFYHRHRWPIAAVWIVVLAANLVTAFAHLSAFDLAAGALLLTAVAAYLLSHQFVHRHARWRVPKEICIAALLTGGAGVFLIRQMRAPGVPFVLAVFGLLCFANCALISVWERQVDRAHGQSSLVVHGPGNVGVIRLVPWLVVVIAAASLLVADAGVAMAGACALASGLLLAATDSAEPSIGRQRARIFADVALMTPLVALVL
jgi:hypothetical protein